MLNGTDLIYRYDGSLDGFLCCVYAAMTKREHPMMIVRADEMQSLLFPDFIVETDSGKATRVADSIRAKISEDMLDFVYQVLLTALPGKETILLSLIRHAFKVGAGLLNDLTDPDVNKLSRAVTHLCREAHLYRGFVRFQQNENALVAIIEPKNQVLPLLLNHFTDRFSTENFLIYDKTHRQALIHSADSLNAPARVCIVPLEDLTAPQPDECESNFRALWRMFHKTIAITQRENPVCQRTLMPKRYWPQMVEHQKDERTNILPPGYSPEGSLAAAYAVH